MDEIPKCIGIMRSENGKLKTTILFSGSEFIVPKDDTKRKAYGYMTMMEEALDAEVKSEETDFVEIESKPL